MRIDISRVDVAPFESLDSQPAVCFDLIPGSRWRVLTDNVFVADQSLELVRKSERVLVSLFPYLVDSDDPSVLLALGGELVAHALTILPDLSRVHLAFSNGVESADDKYRIWFGAAGCERD